MLSWQERSALFIWNQKLAVSWIYQIPCSQVARESREMNHRGETFKYCSHLFIDPEFSHPQPKTTSLQTFTFCWRLKIQARLGYSCHVPQSTDPAGMLVKIQIPRPMIKTLNGPETCIITAFSSVQSLSRVRLFATP